VDTRDVLCVDVGAPPGSRHTAQAGDRRATRIVVLETDLEHVARSAGRGGDAEGVDIALLGEDPGKLGLLP